MSTSDGFKPLRDHTVLSEQDVAKMARGRKRRQCKRKGEGPEARIQKAFVVWARKVGLELSHQNNGSNSKAGRIRLHAMGCTAGAADILIFDPLPRAPRARGLALEFKAPDGEQTSDQESWECRLVQLGWRYHVVRSTEQAIEVCTWYGLPSPPG